MQMLSFIIPCYYSEKTINNVIARIIETVKADGRYEYEIVCVNDGSGDGTYAVLREMASDPKIKVIDLSRNFGQHSALMAGFHYTEGDILVCMDDDGQNPPEEMFKLIDKLEEGYDLVSAKYSKDKRGFIRKFGTWISCATSWTLLNQPRDIELNSYYVFRRYVRDEIIKYDNSYPYVHGLILRVTRNMANVEIPRGKRMSGESGYSLGKLLSLWMNGVTAFSEKPLRLVAIAGMVFSTLGFLVAIIIIIRKLVNPAIAMGYTSTMAMLLFIGGLIMLSLGLLGEYIGRIYISVNNAPQFVVRDTCNVEKDKNE
jgi:undecaprenyl-phosphate 4-deoxy-4-formamido-L-arabinose transferase